MQSPEEATRDPLCLTHFAQAFLQDAIRRFPMLAVRLQMAAHTMPEEAELREYCANVILSQLGQLLFHDLNIFTNASGGDSCFLPGVDFRWFFDHIAENDVATKEHIWNEIRRLTMLVSFVTDPNDPRYKHLQNDFLQTMDPEEVSARIDAFLQSLGGDATGDMDDDECGDFPRRRRSAGHNHCFEWANKLSSMKMGALLTEVLERVRTQFPDIYDGMMHLQQEMDRNPDTNMTPKAQMQRFQQFMKEHSHRWGDIMQMMQDMLQEKIRRGEVKEEELRRETIQILSKMAKMDKHDRKEYMQQQIAAGKAVPGAKLNVTALNNKLAAEKIKGKLRAKLKEREAQQHQADVTFCTQSANVQAWQQINESSDRASQEAALDALVRSIEESSSAKRRVKPTRR